MQDIFSRFKLFLGHNKDIAYPTAVSPTAVSLQG